MQFDRYLKSLEEEFELHAKPERAKAQKTYMRDQFEFYGLGATERRLLQKPFLQKDFLPKKSDLETYIKNLWIKPQRDFQYFTQELAFKYRNQIEENDIAIYEFMVSHKSWWDTVDFIASNLMGAYFKVFPEKTSDYVKKWLASDNIWLQRSALLFQLKYKEQLDTALLADAINALNGSKEFFINKAIGWVLREYSKTNPAWVRTFVNKTVLNSLSKKEALRLF